jgi:hypothetical protein
VGGVDSLQVVGFGSWSVIACTEELLVMFPVRHSVSLSCASPACSLFNQKGVLVQKGFALTKLI